MLIDVGAGLRGLLKNSVSRRSSSQNSPYARECVHKERRRAEAATPAGGATLALLGYEGTQLSYSPFAECLGKGGAVRIFLEPRDLPILYGEYVGEVTLPLPAGGVDMPCIVTQRNDPIILGYEFSGLELPSLLQRHS